LVLLDRRPETLAGFVSRHSHAVDDRRAAAEYLRLFCAYGQDEQSSLWVIAGKTGLPPFLSPCGGDEGDRSRWREEVSPKTFGMRRKREGDHFVVRACLLRGDHLENGCFIVTPAEEGIVVAATSDPEQAGPGFESSEGRIGAELENGPTTSGQFAYHPQPFRDREEWVTPPILERSIPEPRLKLPALEARLLPYLQSGVSMHGQVDLRDLSCETLDDEGGRFWGRHVQIRMDHFVYRQASWEPDLVDRRKTLGERWADWKTRFAAEWLPYWWVKKLGLVETLRQSADFWHPWQLDLPAVPDR
jgi:hypothetical protein